MNALALLLTVMTSMIVLRSGDRIAVEGAVTEAEGIVKFRSGGLLYSLPAGEVEKIESATSSAGKPSRPLRVAESGAAERQVAALRVSDEERKRLIAELEKNHSGQPSAPLAPVIVVTPAPAELKEDEAHWRSQARGHEENVRRAQESLDLLERRARELQDQIHSFFSLGFRPSQFTYQTTQLARTLEEIPYAKLEVTRAERVWQQFREDARRAGVMPGWLR